MGPLTFIGPFVGTWTAPPGVYYVFVECHGGGGDGDGGGGSGGNGGGGGGYTSGIVPVIPGTTYSIVAGGGGGGTSSFNGSDVVGSGGGNGNGGGGGSVDTPAITLVQLIYGGNGAIGIGFPSFAGGNGGGGAKGGVGGTGGDNSPSPGTAGGFPGGGGGGGGGTGETGAAGGEGGAGYLRIRSVFGYRGYHQNHNTGPTNNSTPHDLPINQWTTTKGIGMRRKWILGAIALAPNEFLELSCARLTTPVTFVPTEGDINTPWIVPNGVCQILVECQGDGNGFPNGGGSYGSDGVGGDGGPGGHGGGYGSSIINVVPGTIYNVNITEGSGAFFQDQFFVNIVAGYSGDDEIGGGLGDIVYNGNPGGGGSPGYPQVEDNNGGGGNGGMGGTSGYNSSGGLGGLGAGLNGIPPAFNGSLAPNYGGGGGGGGGGSGAGDDPGAGGLGGMGFVRISWWGFYGLKSPRICLGGE